MSLIKRPVRVSGDTAYVTLTKGYEAIIDALDIPLVENHNWCVRGDRNTMYAVRGEGTGKDQKFFRMHRVILDAPDDSFVDHIDGNGLNNTRKNLRLATPSENSFNQRKRKNNTSGFKGVSLYKATNKYSAKIRLGGKQHFLGYFLTPEEAYAAYQKASKKYHGEFGRV